jgi:hypothetical protein
MKKPRQKTRARSHQLQTQDLTAVRGGTDGVIQNQATIRGGVGAHDDGIISSRS